MIGPLREYLGTDGFLHFAWVIPAAAFLVIFLLSYFNFLLALPRNIRYLFLMAGSIYVIGALGMEMVGGKVVSLMLPDTIYIMVVACEELLEMIGIVVFLYALLTYLRLKLINVDISFTD